jgi:alpha-2-macroglobulin
MSGRPYPKAWVAVCLLLIAALACNITGPAPTTSAPTAPPTGATTGVAATQAPTAAVSPTPLPPIAPRVIDYTPVRGDEVAPSGNITVYFDGPMDKPSVEAAFSVQPSVPGSFSWPDPATVQFKPGTALERAAQYTVTIQNTAKNSAGLALLAPVSFKADTVGFLEVTQVLPAPDAADAEVRSAITVMFNRPVVPLTSLADQASLPNPLVLDPPASGKGEWLNTSIYIFRPDTPLAGGQTYTGRVAAGLQDTTGGLLKDDFVWHFGTQAPAVVSSLPAFNATDFLLTDPISITFNQPMDHASVHSAFHLQPSGGGADIAGQIKWSADDLTMGFYPSQNLPLAAKLQATLDAAAKTAGGATLGAAYTVLFDTVKHPAIVSTSPANGDQSADSRSGFRIGFASPMDVSTLETNIDIQPKPTQVYTSWSDSDLSFFLGWDLKPSTDYVVTLGAGMKDLYGNPIPQGKTVKFHTAALPPEIFFNSQGAVGTYNAYSDTVLYVTSLNLNQAIFNLYKLPLDQFAALTGPNNYDANQKYNPSNADQVRHWSTTLPNSLNQQVLTRVPVAGDQGGALAPGLYYLRMVGAGLPGNQNQILVVSGVNTTLKVALKEALVWATDLDSGQPVPNMPVTIYDEKFQKLAEGQTDANGLLQVTLPDRPDLWTQVYAVSQGGSGPTGFSVGLTDWSTGIDPWDFGLTGDYYPHSTLAYVYTDRPIYRPGQVVYFKADLRNEDNARFSLPAADPLSVSITNDQGQQVYSDTFKTDAFGTLAGQFQLAPQAGLGFYNILLSRGDQQFGNVPFSVAQYQKPDFQVAVASPLSETVQGTTIPVTVDASFFFGGPVSNANVHWSVLSADFAYPYAGQGYYDFYDFDWSANQTGPVYGTFGRLISEKDGQTDAKGHASIDVPADLSNSKLSQIYTVEAMVTDANGQQVSARVQVVVHQGTFYIGVRPEQYVGTAGQPLNVNLITVDWHSNPAPKQALHVVYNDHQWNCALEKDPDTGANTWTCNVKDTQISSQDVTTDDKGQATGTFTPPKGGTYQVKVTGTDAGGHSVTSSTIVWVSSSDFVTWRQDNNDRLNLVADRKAYKPGDTAEILIPSPFQGTATALVTVERGRILSKTVLQLSSNSTIYKLPITADFAPDVFVSVVLVKGVDANNPAPSFKVGTLKLSVSPEQQQIKVTLTPDKAKVGPRDTVTYQIQATDYAGKPVQADFSVGVVDLAVLSLSAPNSSPILDAFYGEAGLSVRTSLGLTLGVDRLNVAADHAKGGGGGSEGGFDQVRTNFLDTAFWNANVVTDDTGKATVSVKLPDNLTTWRLDARGLTAQDTLVGQGTVDIVATKDLLIQPTTPRFFVVGDQAQLGAEINNNTANDIQATVTLTGTGVSLDSPVSQVVTVKANDRVNVNWNVTALDAAAADLTFSVAGGGLQDASKPTVGTPPDQLLPIYKYSAPTTTSTAGQLDAAGSRLESVSLPRRFDATQGSLDVQLDPSLAAGLTGALNDLKANPYDDTEGIVSSFLPNVLTYQALKKLGQTSPGLETDLTNQVNTALQRLYALQHVDGGWGWWNSDDSDAYISAYTLFGLVKAQKAGFAVNASVITNAKSYLNDQLVQPTSVDTTENWRLNRQAFILLALAEAGQANTSAAVELFDAREQLDTYARAYLALALHVLDASDTTRTTTLLSDINNAAIVSATGAHWEEQTADWRNMNTDTRSTAIVLDALVTLDAGNSLIPNVVRWLMVARKATSWATSQETAWSLIGLTDWLAASGELKGNYDYSVTLNGKNLSAGTVKADNLQNPVQLHVAVADLLKDQANQLSISRGAGDGRLYYTANLNVYEPVGQVHAVNQGISVSRQYRLKTDACGGQDQPECKVITEAQAGQDIEVHVSLVAPNDLYYVTLEDPLPAGAEAVDTSLQTTSVVGQPPALDAADPLYYGWGWWWFSNTDLRDEKVVLFASFLPKGTYEYTYVMHASLPGTYQVIPTQARESYFPDVQGTGDGVVFKINP